MNTPLYEIVAPIAADLPVEYDSRLWWCCDSASSIAEATARYAIEGWLIRQLRAYFDQVAIGTMRNGTVQVRVLDPRVRVKGGCWFAFYGQSETGSLVAAYQRIKEADDACDCGDPGCSGHYRREPCELCGDPKCDGANCPKRDVASLDAGDES